MARNEKRTMSKVTPKDFIDAWKAEARANGNVDGVVKRLGNKMTRESVIARATNYRKKKIDLARFQTNRNVDWDALRKYANGGNGHSVKTDDTKKRKSAKK